MLQHPVDAVSWAQRITVTVATIGLLTRAMSVS
jgi:hypothetical protein